MKKPLVSVIICNYNSEKYLERCLSSLFEGSYENLEVILVNDCSPGDDSHIVESFKGKLNLKKIVNDKNLGLFRSRLVGFAESSGEYITFLDADDELSVDFIRSGLEESIACGADMLRCHVSIRKEDQDYRFIRNHISQERLYLEGKKGIEFLAKQEGRDWTLHTIWGVIYKRRLVMEGFEILQNVSDKITMCEDVLFSAILYFCAKKIVSSECWDNVYFYRKHHFNITGNSENIKRIVENIDSIKHVRKFLVLFFQGRLEKNYINNLENCLKAYERLWQEKKSKTEEDKNLYTEEINSIITDIGFFDLHLPFNFSLYENIKRKIINKDTKLVSFDLFDTLVKRNVLYPTDLFLLLEKYVVELCGTSDTLYFKDIRILSEGMARSISNKEEVTLDEIYLQLNKIFKINEELLNIIKEKEIELEVEFCVNRKFVKNLFNLSKFMKKKTIIISDIYLRRESIERILKKNDIEADELYISAEYGITKNTGRLFEHVKSAEGFEYNHWVHIGDNLISDIKIPKELGINVIHIEPVREPLIKLLDNLYNFKSIQNELSLSIIFSKIANDIFDVPFSYKENYFYLSPVNVGKIPLFSHVLSVTKWLKRQLSYLEIDTIQFLARDGYLFKKAFEELYKNDNFKLYYSHLNRKTLLFLQIKDVKDLKYLYRQINYRDLNPYSAYSLFSSFLVFSNEKEYLACLLKYKIPNLVFENVFEFNEFIDAVVEPNFDWKNVIEIRKKIISNLTTKISKKTAIFDIGYSCRSEVILSNIFENTTFYSFNVGVLPERASQRAEIFDIPVISFYGKTLEMPGAFRELLVSSSEPGVDSFESKGNTLELVCSKNFYSYKEKFILERMQTSCLEKIRGLNPYSSLNFIPQDLNSLFEIWLKKPSSDSLELFSNIRNEDIQSHYWHTKPMSEAWLASLKTINSINCTTSKEPHLSNFAKLIVYSFTDRARLKRGVSKKLKSYPFLFRLTRLLYRLTKR